MQELRQNFYMFLVVIIKPRNSGAKIVAYLSVKQCLFSGSGTLGYCLNIILWSKLVWDFVVRLPQQR